MNVADCDRPIALRQYSSPETHCNYRLHAVAAMLESIRDAVYLSSKPDGEKK
jgi:hypothetical protein